MTFSVFTRLLHSPFALQNIILGIFIVFILGFRPSYQLSSGEVFGSEFFGEKSIQFPITKTGFLDNFSGFKPTVSDTKVRKKTITYTVRSGDRVEKIARKFGISVSSILWANDITVKSILQIGSELRIPPRDGVYYTIKKGDTLDSISTKYDIEIQKIYALNDISPEKLRVGREVFLPEARNQYFAPAKVKPKPKPKVPIVKTPWIAPSKGTPSLANLSIPKPTKGILTQKFHSRHFAIDIGNKVGTPIYAVLDGTVIKESHSGWNYGYGRFILIDHGNGIQTMSAHNNYNYFGVGEKVKAGERIAAMGSTGNSTGPHIHFELRVNGRKVNPALYFK